MAARKAKASGDSSSPSKNRAGGIATSRPRRSTRAAAADNQEIANEVRAHSGGLTTNSVKNVKILPPTIQPTTAASTVLSIHELLSQILLCLPTREVVRNARVSRGWQTTIMRETRRHSWNPLPEYVRPVREGRPARKGEVGFWSLEGRRSRRGDQPSDISWNAAFWSSSVTSWAEAPDNCFWVVRPHPALFRLQPRLRVSDHARFICDHPTFGRKTSFTSWDRFMLLDDLREAVIHVNSQQRTQSWDRLQVTSPASTRLIVCFRVVSPGLWEFTVASRRVQHDRGITFGRLLTNAFGAYGPRRYDGRVVLRRLDTNGPSSDPGPAHPWQGESLRQRILEAEQEDGGRAMIEDFTVFSWPEQRVVFVDDQEIRQVQQQERSGEDVLYSTDSDDSDESGSGSDSSSDFDSPLQSPPPTWSSDAASALLSFEHVQLAQQPMP